MFHAAAQLSCCVSFSALQLSVSERARSMVYFIWSHTLAVPRRARALIFSFYPPLCFLGGPLNHVGQREGAVIGARRHLPPPFLVQAQLLSPCGGRPPAAPPAAVPAVPVVAEPAAPALGHTHMSQHHTHQVFPSSRRCRNSKRRAKLPQRLF